MGSDKESTLLTKTSAHETPNSIILPEEGAFQKTNIYSKFLQTVLKSFLKFSKTFPNVVIIQPISYVFLLTSRMKVFFFGVETVFKRLLSVGLNLRENPYEYLCSNQSQVGRWKATPTWFSGFTSGRKSMHQCIIFHLTHPIK